MTEVGTVETVVPLKVGVIVAVRLMRPEVLIRIGASVRIGKGAAAAVRGVKLWPGRMAADLLFDDQFTLPVPGDPVYLES